MRTLDQFGIDEGYDRLPVAELSLKTTPYTFGAMPYLGACRFREVPPRSVHPTMPNVRSRALRPGTRYRGTESTGPRPPPLGRPSSLPR